MTDTNKNVMADAIASTGNEWKATLEDLSKTPWSTLISCLGSAEQILRFLGLDRKLDPTNNTTMQNAAGTHGPEAFQQALMQHVGEIIMFAHEKISAEVDRRFSLVKIN